MLELESRSFISVRAFVWFIKKPVHPPLFFVREKANLHVWKYAIKYINKLKTVLNNLRYLIW